MSAGTQASESTSVYPRWLVVSTLVLSLAGLAVAIYLTISHYTDNAALVCQVNAVIDCAQVTSSPQSVVLGIPVAVLGLVYFVPMTVLTSPWAWRSELPAVRWLRLAGVGVGLLFVVYLVAVELAVIGKICEWCTGVHVITIALFALVVVGEYRSRPA
ncbi:MAG TPA: vitamin K epoxide reductase family protein [Kutzneria sp.]|jgi:uncharacterized membrane protein